MAKLTWDQTGERLYESGDKYGVLYPGYTPAKDATPASYGKGVAWNGLTAVTESPSGAEATDLYADDIKYLSLRSAEEFGFTIEAYTYPEEWAKCDGSSTVAKGVVIGQQKREMFGFCYRTVLGNDVDHNDHGYKLHLIYGATASPSERSYATVNDSPEAITFSWECSTNPIDVPGYKAISSITIDSTKADKTKLKKLEDELYGTESKEPRLPLPSEVFTMMADD